MINKQSEIMKEAFIYRTLTTAIIILFFFIPLSANINVRHIALNIGFDIEKQKATGSAEITLSPVVFSKKKKTIT